MNRIIHRGVPYTSYRLANRGFVLFLNPPPMGNWEPIWIASLDISPWIEQKIQVKHGINVEDLRWNLVGNSRILGRTLSSHKHGSRTMVFVLLTVRKYLVAYIDLIDDYYSAWSLRTAQITSQIPIVGG